MGNTAQFWHFFLKQIIVVSVLPGLCRGDAVSAQRTPCTVTIRLSRHFTEPNSPTQSRSFPFFKKKTTKRKKRGREKIGTFFFLLPQELKNNGNLKQTAFSHPFHAGRTGKLSVHPL